MGRIDLLKELTDAFGVSGYEQDVVSILKKHFGDHAQIAKDKLGSVIAKKVGTSEKPKIMFAAHMDEVGFMVKEITKQGFIKFITIGGWWTGNLPGLRVKIKTRKVNTYQGLSDLSQYMI